MSPLVTLLINFLFGLLTILVAVVVCVVVPIGLQLLVWGIDGFAKQFSINSRRMAIFVITLSLISAIAATTYIGSLVAPLVLRTLE